MLKAREKYISLGDKRFSDLKPGFYLVHGLVKSYDCFEEFGECNNNCIFCCDLEFKKNKNIDRKPSIKKSSIKSNRILLCCGEPTGLNAIIEKVKYLKTKYQIIAMATNGRRLKDIQFTDELFRSGIDEILISLHGHNAKVHDRITRVEGSFSETVEGIKNAVAFAKKQKNKNLKIVINLVLTKGIIHSLYQFILFVKNLGVNILNFDALIPLGAGKKAFKAEVPRYRDIVTEFKNAIVQCNKNSKLCNLTVFLSNVPLCISRAANCSNFVFIVNKADEFKDLIYKKTESICGKCAVRSFCEGIFAQYVKIYGLDEFCAQAKND